MTIGCCDGVWSHSPGCPEAPEKSEAWQIGYSTALAHSLVTEEKLQARLAEAERLLAAVPRTSERESILDLHAAILAFLRARPADSGPAGKECWCGLEWEPNCPAHRTEAESFGRYRDAGRDQSWPGAAVSADAGLTVNSECPHCNGTIVYGTIYCSYCGSTWTNVRK